MSVHTKEPWYPEEDPITGAPLFMFIEHPTRGMIPTYGGPFDSYTLAERDHDESNDKEIHYMRERYDHDEGCWIDNEIEALDVVMITLNRLLELEALCDQLLAALQMALADHMTEAYLHPLRDGTVEAIRCAIASAEKRGLDADDKSL